MARTATYVPGKITVSIPYYQLADASLPSDPLGSPNTDTNDSRGQQGGSNSPVHFYPSMINGEYGRWVFNSQQGHDCAVVNPQPDPTVFGLFKPLDPANSSTLGAYCPLHTWAGIPSNRITASSPGYE